MSEVKFKKPNHKLPEKLRAHMWPKGFCPNKNGRGKGHLSFETQFLLAIQKLSKELNKTPDEVDLAIIKAGIKQAIRGNFNFYKDIIDRRFGKAPDVHELTGKDGEPLFTPEDKIKTKTILDNVFK